MSSCAIQVEGLGKRYQLNGDGAAGYRTLREDLMRWRPGGRGRSEFWALRDVSFQVGQGEVLGIVGRNGAGKSTLLKILSRIVEPTTGGADLHGRVGSLLEVGTGFHPELTGRENIFLSGAILGMRRGEIRAEFDAIVAFAGVERFIDMPCKHYSSGMYMRLAFAVAAHLRSEILLVDEVLAVGDAEFQAKCLGKMAEVGRSGRTVLFVSHRLPAIVALCPRSLWLESGRVRAIGASQQVVADYLAERARGLTTSLADRPDRRGDGRLRFEAVSFDGGGVEAPAASGGELRIRVRYRLNGGGAGAGRFAFVFFSGGGDPMFACDTRFTRSDFETLPETGEIICRIAELPLVAGRYWMNTWCAFGGQVADFVEGAACLEVEPGDFFGAGVDMEPSKNGVLLVRHGWELATTET